MAEITVWLQLKTGKIRKISAISLTWTWGRVVRGTVMYQSTAGTVVKIESFEHRQEAAPAPGTASVDSANLAKSLTVAQEQIALTYETEGSANLFAEISPHERTTATAVAHQIVAAPATLQKLIDVSVWDYIRFSGTELSASGIVFGMDELAGMFTTEPSAAQL